MYTDVVGMQFDPQNPVRNGRVCLDVRAQRRGPDGFRAAIYLPSRAGQVRVAVDVPPGTLQSLAQQYQQLLIQGDQAEVAGIDFVDYLPESDEGGEFVGQLEALLGPALGLLGPLLGGGGGLAGLLGPLLGGMGGGGGLAGLLGPLLGGMGGGGGLGGVLGGLQNLGGSTPSAPGLGGLLGAILGGGQGAGMMQQPRGGGGLFEGLGSLFQMAMQGGGQRKDPGVIPAQVTVQVPTAGSGPPGPGGSPGVVLPDWQRSRVSGLEEPLDLCPPLEGTALVLGEALADQSVSGDVVPFLAVPHAIVDALREVHLNPHRYGELAPELASHLMHWLAASDNYAGLQLQHPEAQENLHKLLSVPQGHSAVNVVRSMLRAG